jgi:hypothetical protein
MVCVFAPTAAASAARSKAATASDRALALARCRPELPSGLCFEAGPTFVVDLAIALRA